MPARLPAATVEFIHDDLPAATERARAQGKALFVDAWAPWCHTCLSMKGYVLNDPSLHALAERVIFVAIDTDRPENAAFLDQYTVSVWPTFYVMDPAGGKVIGHWPGAASVREIKGFIEESVELLERTRRGTLPAGDPLRELMEAKEAHATGSYKRAAQAYERAVAKMPAGAKRRSEALLGWIQALYRGANFSACARTGTAHMTEMEGAVAPADYASVLLTCASRLPPGEVEQQARRAAVLRLQAITREPHAEASADDRADALRILAEGLLDVGDVRGASAARRARIAVLDQASANAPSPEAASAYDYALAMAYLAVDRQADAIRMLEQRERELPELYEPPARLAEVLAKLGRTEQALAAINRSIGRAYGPRRLRYLRFRADLLRKLGDHAGEVATLREEVAGHEALAKGQANRDRLHEAKRRLAEAETRAKAKAPSRGTR
jgi:thioredoxin-like negative regulator of GroEL